MSTTTYKVTMARHAEKHWDREYSTHTPEGENVTTPFTERQEAEAECGRRNDAIAQQMAADCGITVEQWERARAQVMDKNWHVMTITKG